MSKFERQYLLPNDFKSIIEDGKVIGYFANDSMLTSTLAFKAYLNALKPNRAGVLMHGIYMDGG